MMAAAEARTFWQRMANHCFVEEDAKRAPKLACYPSSSNALFDSGCGAMANGKNHTAADCTLNWNPAHSNMPDTKWWLHPQSTTGRLDYRSEHLNFSEQELDDKVRESRPPSSTLDGDLLPCTKTVTHLDKNLASYMEPNTTVSTAFMRHDSEIKFKELKAVNNDSQQILKSKADFGEYYEGDDLMDWKTVDSLISMKPDIACLGVESNWIGIEKTEPWWRVADKDELASLVLQKSLDHFENCDLPPPQKLLVSRDPLLSFDGNVFFSSYYDESLWDGIGRRVNCSLKNSTSGVQGQKWTFVDTGRSPCDSEKSCRDSCGSTKTTKDPLERTCASDSDPTNSQLLEALCRSQTRAREAEMAAKEAYNDKEHIVKLFLRQASHLFAYKQWLRLLQLESLYLQLKIKEHRISTLLPAFPWMALKENQFHSNGHKEVRRKAKKRRECRVCRCAFAFAIGLSLAGAGLLLGWTLGCLLPVV